MSKKIAIGIVNTYDSITYNKCISSLPKDCYTFSVHHTTDNIINNNNRYMSNGSLYNILLRKFVETDATYFFLIKSNLIIEDTAIFQDYINTASVFGTWFMTRGHKSGKNIPIEDDRKKTTLKLYENLNQSLIFMLKSHITHCGWFDESYTNINASDDTNLLEIYDYYHRLENKIKYLPKGYFPDIDMSLAKAREIDALSKRPGLMPNTTDNTTKIYGKFYLKNKFIPGQHKIDTQQNAIISLERIQKIYGQNI